MALIFLLMVHMGVSPACPASADIAFGQRDGGESALHAR